MLYVCLRAVAHAPNDSALLTDIVVGLAVVGAVEVVSDTARPKSRLGFRQRLELENVGSAVDGDTGE